MVSWDKRSGMLVGISQKITLEIFRTFFKTGVASQNVSSLKDITIFPIFTLKRYARASLGSFILGAHPLPIALY